MIARIRLPGFAAFAIPILGALGVALCVELVQVHLETWVGAVHEGLVCGGARRFDCGDVAAHPSAWLFGLPVAVWGLLFYAVVSTLGLAALVHRDGDRKAAALVLVALATAALVLDAYLAWRMLFTIGSVCPLCVATYALNLLLFIAGLAIVRSIPGRVGPGRLVPSRPVLATGDGEDYYREVFKLATLVLLLVGTGLSLAWSLGPLLDIRRYGNQQIDELLTRIRTRPAQVDGGALAGLPARGSGTPSVDLVLVADFRCSLCRALANEADRLIEDFPEDVRIRHVDAPLDVACNPRLSLDLHPGSCWLAEAGACAHEQGKFWEYHRLLFKDLRLAEVLEPNVRARIGELGIDDPAWSACLAAGRGRETVARETAWLDSLGITFTPSTIVNGQVKPGSMFPWMLRRVVTELRRKKGGTP